MTIAKLKQYRIISQYWKGSKLTPEMQQLKDEVEEYINGVDDCFIRELLRYRYLLGYSWAKVSVKAGGYASEDCLRKIAERYLAKHLKKEGTE